MEFKELKQILEQYDKLKKSAVVDFVMYHAAHKVGDIAQDNNTKIIVDKISVTVSHGRPHPIYRGFELKQDGTPRKDKRIAYIFGQSPCKEGEFVTI
jgi:hypothetical protein